MDYYNIIAEIFDLEMFYQEKLFILEAIYNISENVDFLPVIANLQYEEGLSFKGALDFYNLYLEKTMPNFSEKFFNVLNKNYNINIKNNHKISKESLLLCDRYRTILLLIGLLVFKNCKNDALNAIKTINKLKKQIDKQIKKFPKEKDIIESHINVSNLFFAEKISDINESELINTIALNFCPSYEIGYLNLIEGYLYNDNLNKAKKIFNKQYKSIFCIDSKVKTYEEIYNYIEKRYSELGSERNSILCQRNMLKKGIFKSSNILKTRDSIPKISIIMPCYNSEKYLPLTLLSIQAQTFEDFEIIIIDDCSTDNSVNIINDFCQKDSRFKLIKLNKNSGAGNARNEGIKVAKGEYIIFLDCDDVFSKKILEVSYNSAINYNVDIVFFKAGIYNGYIKKYLKKQWDCLFEIDHYINKIYTPEEVQDTIFQTSMGVPWNKLYRKSLIDKYKLRFQEIPKHNDTSFILSSYAVAKNWVIIKDVLLIYRRHLENSITENNDDTEILKNSILKKIKQFLVENNLYEKYKTSFEKCTDIF